ncbi:MAG: hypothetical protein LLG02_16960 [Pelosinus sp.]|nr:hypothetical protein [Pelosinus sp.]
MEEILKQILSEVQGLSKRIDKLEDSMTIVKDDVTDMKSDVTILKSDVTDLKSDVTILKSDVSSFKSDVTDLKSNMAATKDDIIAIKSDMATKTQQNENTGFIQALISRTDIIDAKLDGLAVNTASKEAVAKIDAKLNVLNDRLFNQEADIQLLKRAQ